MAAIDWELGSQIVEIVCFMGAARFERATSRM